ncbi:MAG: hypothetical protein II458_05820 [Oscillospiraceae bacterium]|nr:hypothetical protein [Oscillospiraceae bacterium]
MNAYKIDFMKGTITITADFAKAMNDTTTKEYKTIAKVLKDYPNMEVVQRSHKTPTRYRNSDGSITARNQFKNLTYERMERFMASIPNGDEYRAQYDFIKRFAEGTPNNAYAMTRKWFAEQFPKYRTDPLFYTQEENAPKVINFLQAREHLEMSSAVGF